MVLKLLSILFTFCVAQDFHVVKEEYNPKAEWKSIQQTICKNRECDIGCTQFILPVNECKPDGLTSSLIMTCSEDGKQFNQTQYHLPGCRGNATVVPGNTSTCYRNGIGSHIQFVCQKY